MIKWKDQLESRIEPDVHLQTDFSPSTRGAILHDGGATKTHVMLFIDFTVSVEASPEEAKAKFFELILPKLAEEYRLVCNLAEAERDERVGAGGGGVLV